ncbi:MAG: transcriptional repressor LexA [Dehalococcoidales bacterium]|nr:transcriptional repressor LexA [Dehalococcoidales bacterium]
MVKELSSKPQQIIDFIYRFVEDRGYPPTIRDIASGCAISSTSVVKYNLDILERNGYIRRHGEIARGIGLVAHSTHFKYRLLVPVIGQIAAGKPIPVPTSDTWDTAAFAETIEVTRDLTRGRDGIYALRVRGWSMVDALVSDGDIVLMEYVNAVDNGEVAAIWLKAEREATLKKFYSEAGKIRLQPANTRMKPIYVEPDNVEVQGRVIAVIRQLGPGR